LAELVPQLSLLWRPLVAAVLGGAACGVVGVWVVMMNVPFVGVAMSHAAFAGAVAGLLVGVNPLITALAFCCVAAALIGPVAERSELDPGVSLGIVFSLMLGLAFLGIGLLKERRAQALPLIWGNILLTTRSDLVVLAVSLAAVLAFVLLCYKETLAVLFNREVARSVGIPERFFFFAMLLLSGLVVTANLSTIGGLLVFSLVVNPPSAAYQLTWRLKTMYLLSALFAVGSCLVGLALSWLFDVPAGAVIIVASSAAFGLALAFSPKRRRLRQV